MKVLVAARGGTLNELERVLAAGGHAAAFTYSADELLARARSEDWTMYIVAVPEVARCCAELRARIGSTPAIVAILERDPPGNPHAAIAAGANDYAFVDGDLSARIAVSERWIRERASSISADEALRLSEERAKYGEENFRLIIEHIPDTVVLHRGGIIMYVNPACVTTFGYDSSAEIIGRDVREFLHSEHRDSITERIRARETTGTPSAPGEFRGVTKSGRLIILEAAPVHELMFEGAPASLVFARDITQRREIQERLLASERLASMGSLAACIAHEINNPLTYVIGNLSFAARGLSSVARGAAKTLDPTLEMAVADAREGIERVRRFVGDLTALSQPEQDERHVLDLRRVLESSINVAWNEIRHRARLERSWGDAPPVVANEVRLGQVFLNLLLNSARAIPEGTASEHAISVSVETDDAGRAVVAIGEVGPFSASAEGGGEREVAETARGLGVTISHTIVRGLGGDLAVEGEGTSRERYRVVLPAAEGRPAPPPMRRVLVEGPEKLDGRARILVVDDEPVIAATMRRALEGHDIYIVTSGRDALELCRGESFDLVLCDLMMPDFTGMDLYEELRRDEAGNEKRIIFMTGGAFTDRARKFLSTVPWVEKPFDVDEIQSVVQRYFRQNEELR